MLTSKYLFASYYLTDDDKIVFVGSVANLMNQRNHDIAAQASLEVIQFVNKMVKTSEDRMENHFDVHFLAVSP